MVPDSVSIHRAVRSWPPTIRCVPAGQKAIDQTSSCTPSMVLSGWVVFTPSPEFDDYSFDYRVPARVGTAQYVGVWSDISGRGAPLAVRSITIEPLD